MSVSINTPGPKPENSGGKQADGKFAPGQSGNPNGKPKGAKNHATRMVEKLLQDGAADVVNAVLKAARDGDMAAAKLVLDRLYPVPKGRAINLPLPAPDSPEALTDAYRIVLAAMGDGSITPDDAGAVTKVLGDAARATAMQALADQISEIKRHVGLSQ